MQPHPINIVPIANVAVCHAPFGSTAPMNGMITLLTKDCTNAVVAPPIMNATASPITLYSFKKSLNSDIIQI